MKKQVGCLIRRGTKSGFLMYGVEYVALISLKTSHDAIVVLRSFSDVCRKSLPLAEGIMIGEERVLIFYDSV